MNYHEQPFYQAQGCIDELRYLEEEFKIDKSKRIVKIKYY